MGHSDLSPSNNPRHLIESGIQEVLLPLIKEHFESYLRSHVGRMTGINYSGSFVVEDLLLEDMIGPNEDFGLLKAIVRISSGTQEIPLIVKCFLQSQISGMAPLANAAQSVEGILAQDSLVKTLRLLHFSHADLSIFFEGIPFHLGSFAKSSLSHAQKGNRNRHDWSIQALEACALGCITITNFHFEKRYKKEYGEHGLIVANTAEDLRKVLVNLLQKDREELLELKHKAREWVERLHSYKAVGKRLGSILGLK